MESRGIVRIALLAAIIATLGMLPSIILPIGVPITAQTLGVMLAGIILGPQRGALAVLLFLFVVLLGAPLLSGGRGGLGVLFGPTVGFLLGFVPAAFVSGLVMARMSLLQALVAAAVFVPGDLLKALATAFIAEASHRSYPAAIASRSWPRP